MFGIKHIKFDSMTYVLHFKNGNIKREGRGLSFFYFAPNSSIAAIPMTCHLFLMNLQMTTKRLQFKDR